MARTMPMPRAIRDPSGPLPLKPPIGGPRNGRPVRGKPIPPKKGRIRPIAMAPAGKPQRNYLVGRSFGHQGLSQGPQKKLGKVRLGPKVR